MAYDILDMFKDMQAKSDTFGAVMRGEINTPSFQPEITGRGYTADPRDFKLRPYSEPLTYGENDYGYKLDVEDNAIVGADVYVRNAQPESGNNELGKIQTAAALGVYEASGRQYTEIDLDKVAPDSGTLPQLPQAMPGGVVEKALDMGMDLDKPAYALSVAIEMEMSGDPSMMTYLSSSEMRACNSISYFLHKYDTPEKRAALYDENGTKGIKAVLTENDNPGIAHAGHRSCDKIRRPADEPTIS